MNTAHHQRPPIWTLPFTLTFVAHFVVSLGFWTFVHLPGFLQNLGAGEARIGVVIGVMSVAAILVRPWLGVVMDQRGRRFVLLFGCGANALATAGYLLVNDLGALLYLVRCLHGFGEAAVFSVMFTIAADIVPESRRTEGIAVFGVSGLLPLSLGGLLGDRVLASGSYGELFVLATVLAGAGLLIALPVPESKPQPEAPQPITLASIPRVFVAPALLPLWLLALGFSLGITSYFSFLKTFVNSTGVGSVGVFFATYSLVSVLLRLFFSWVPDRYGAKRVLLPAMLSLGVGLVLLSQTGSASGLILAGAACGAGHGYVFPIVSAMVIDRAAVSARGVAMTIYTALFDVALVLGAPVLGAIVEQANYTVMFFAAAMTVAVSTLAFFLIDHRRRLLPIAAP
jgi:MFS family permease